MADTGTAVNSLVINLTVQGAAPAKAAMAEVAASANAVGKAMGDVGATANRTANAVEAGAGRAKKAQKEQDAISKGLADLERARMRELARDIAAISQERLAQIVKQARAETDRDAAFKRLVAEEVQVLKWMAEEEAKAAKERELADSRRRAARQADIEEAFKQADAAKRAADAEKKASLETALALKQKAEAVRYLSSLTVEQRAQVLAGTKGVEQEVKAALAHKEATMARVKAIEDQIKAEKELAKEQRAVGGAAVGGAPQAAAAAATEAATAIEKQRGKIYQSLEAMFGPADRKLYGFNNKMRDAQDAIGAFANAGVNGKTAIIGFIAVVGNSVRIFGPWGAAIAVAAVGLKGLYQFITDTSPAIERLNDRLEKKKAKLADLDSQLKSTQSGMDEYIESIGENASKEDRLKNQIALTTLEIRRKEEALRAEKQAWDDLHASMGGFMSLAPQEERKLWAQHQVVINEHKGKTVQLAKREAGAKQMQVEQQEKLVALERERERILTVDAELSEAVASAESEQSKAALRADQALRRGRLVRIAAETAEAEKQRAAAAEAEKRAKAALRMEDEKLVTAREVVKVFSEQNLQRQYEAGWLRRPEEKKTGRGRAPREKKEEWPFDIKSKDLVEGMEEDITLWYEMQGEIERQAFQARARLVKWVIEPYDGVEEAVTDAADAAMAAAEEAIANVERAFAGFADKPGSMEQLQEQAKIIDASFGDAKASYQKWADFMAVSAGELTEDEFNSMMEASTAFASATYRDALLASAGWDHAMGIAEQYFDTVAEGMAQAVVMNLAYGESLKDATNALMNQIFIEASTKALLEGAYALGSLAIGNFASASLHGKAALAFGAVAALAGIGAKASGGFNAPGAAGREERPDKDKDKGAGRTPRDRDYGQDKGGGRTTIINVNNFDGHFYATDEKALRGLGEAAMRGMNRRGLGALRLHPDAVDLGAAARARRAAPSR